MKLIEALEILRKTPANAEKFIISLVCGFTPLHLQTMLAARMQLVYPERQVKVHTGLYGDFLGNLERTVESGHLGIVILEWQDLDPRLGIRSLGSWLPEAMLDILGNAKARSASIRGTVEKFSKKAPLVICVPTLPLPPISYTPTWQASSFEMELRATVSSLASEIAQFQSVKVVSPQQLDLLSPPGERLDVESEVQTGFPYKVVHAAALAELVSYLVQNRAPKKGLITDLDDTLWKGILGELGSEGVTWDLDHHSHMHGVYQQLLHALSAEGVLVAVASKNDPKLVDEVFSNRSPIVPKSALFPIEAHWGAKSGSVARILQAWNVGADSVVFVDDSPMELAEVKATHPEVECILFPRTDTYAIYELLQRLRDLFGKSALQPEDAIRLGSLRQADTMHRSGELSENQPERFLQNAEAELTLNFNKAPLDPRALELINKTNQFNLNGKRYTEASWQAYLRNPSTFLMLVAYKDKYGPLGKIAVLAGHRLRKSLRIDIWVMSCRAFSRRIEHQCLEQLFERFDVDELVFDFVGSTRNEPIRIFLTDVLGTSPESGCCLSRQDFLERRPKAYHRISEITNA